MDLNGSAPTQDAGQVPTTHEQLADGFAAEIAAERGEKTPVAPEKELSSATPGNAEVANDAPADIENSEAVEADDTATAETDDAAETPSVEQSIAAPSGMSDADKTLYAKLPSEMKAWVAKQEAARTADYTRKTQDVAAQRKRYDTGVAGVMQRLEILDKQLAAFTDNDMAPPNPNLRMTDPIAYDDQLANYMQAKHLKELAGQERQKVHEEHQRVSAAMHQRFEQERVTQLREMAPELFGENGKKIGSQIQSYAAQVGYSPEQLRHASATDIITLWKAQRFDCIEAAKKQVKTVATPAPKVSQPGPAKAVGRPSTLLNAVKALDANPSRAALAAAYAAEIQSERR